jgi:hypothetical protein
MKMGKLHELLAVEGDLKSAAQRALKDVSALFQAGLLGITRRYTPLRDGDMRLPDERTELATTVPIQLDLLSRHMGRWIDIAYQKEVTNTETMADVIVDGTLLLGAVPAPALLNLESKLAEVRKVYAAMPVNDAAERWQFHDGQGCWVSEPRITYRTQKVRKSFVAYEATKEHAAQVQVYTEDDRVGTWETTIFSGAVTAVQKQAYLDRIDALQRAVKQARQRANNIDAMKGGIAESVFKFINGE